LAAERGFAEFCTVRKGADPLLTAVLILLGSAVPLVLLLAMAQAGIRSPKLVGWALGILLVGIVMAIGRLVRGYLHVYLFEHGLIRSKNGRLRAVPWTQVRELRLWRAGGAIAGTLLAYYVVTTDRKLIGIAAKVKHGRDEFGDHLQRLVSAVGAPVVEGGPALGERRVRR